MEYISAECDEKRAIETSGGFTYKVGFLVRNKGDGACHVLVVTVEKPVFDKYQVGKTYALLPTGQAL